jgi:hypothetical protein
MGERRLKMSSSKLIRWGGLAAMLGSALGIVVAPIITSAYSLIEENGNSAPPWEPTLSNLLGPFLTFASPETVYAAYGKVYFLIFLGLLLGLAGLYIRRRGHAGRLEHWGFRLSFVGLALNLLGNVPDYWIGEDILGERLHTMGFVAGTALGLLILTIGSIILGIALLRAGDSPRLGAWLLVLTIPGLIVVSLLGFGNIPSGPALWFCFAWMALGHFLWSRENAPTGQNARPVNNS